MKRETIRGAYIPPLAKEYFLNGDAYMTVDELFRLCRSADRSLDYDTFRNDLSEQLRLGRLQLEGSRLYLRKTLCYENAAAGFLADILRKNDLDAPRLPDTLTVNGLPLCDEQREAVRQALSHRLSMITGGAGCGKTTLIRAITVQSGVCRTVLCAPTGKAARNLQAKTALPARTVHGALGLCPDDDFLLPVTWAMTDLVIVDEASMMTLEMLAGILSRVHHRCRVVLLGDPNQLLSVGSGNVLPDLLELGIPSIHLKTNHRQDADAVGLMHNVCGFDDIHCSSQLHFDESFALRELSGPALNPALVNEAAARYLANESVQVLSPTNRSVRELNLAIRRKVNPAQEGKKLLQYAKQKFWDGDRVIICKNDPERRCSNGDVGILKIFEDHDKSPLYSVVLPDGRCPTWTDFSGLMNMDLAYALTVHKSQGSEYDTILMPLSDSFSSMLYRNLAYTGLSRARKQVLLYGQLHALDAALQRPARVRRSMLVAKTRQQLARASA